MNFRKKLKHGSYSVVITAVFIAAAILLNVVFGLIFGNLNLRFDLSEGRMFSIENSTKEYIAALDDTVNFYFFNTEERFTGRGYEYTQTHEIAQRFAEANRSFTITFVDRLTSPLAVQFGGNLTDFCIVIESERTGRFQIVRESEYRIFEYFFMGEQITWEDMMFIENFMQQPVQRSLSAGAERAFLSAIMTVTDITPVRVAFTTGFEEAHELSAAMADLLAVNGYTIEEIDMLTANRIDPDIDFVVVFMPAYDFNISARTALTDWLDNSGTHGKTLLYFPSPEMPPTPNLNALTEEWGLRAEYGFIRQSNSSYALLALDDYENLQFVRATGEAFAEGIADRTLLSWYTRPVTRLFENRGGFSTTSLIETYEGSYFNPFFITEEEAEEFLAKLEIMDVAAMSSRSRIEGGEMLTSRVIVLGSFYLFNAEPLQTQQLSNADLLLNIFNDISGRGGAQARIIPKSFYSSAFEITLGQANMLAIIFVVIIPLLIITAGLVVFFRRRYR
jgi:hypothetical protein